MTVTPSTVTPASGPGVSPDLAFSVEWAEPLRYAVAPTIAFRLQIESRGGQAIRSVVLTTQIRIAATRRSYDEGAQERLVELFGDPGQWGHTLRSLLWTHTTLQVPPFTGSTVVEMPVSCTYDLDVAAAKYLDALAGGDVPLEFLFSGTIFYSSPEGHLRTALISWDKEAELRMPVSVWKETMEHYFPGTAWLRLRKETFDRLHAYRARHALPTWEDAVEKLLADEGGDR